MKTVHPNCACGGTYHTVLAAEHFDDFRQGAVLPVLCENCQHPMILVDSTNMD